MVMTKDQRQRLKVATCVYDALQRGVSVIEITLAVRLLKFPSTWTSDRAIAGLKCRYEQKVPVSRLINGYWTNRSHFKM